MHHKTAEHHTTQQSASQLHINNFRDNDSLAYSSNAHQREAAQKQCTTIRQQTRRTRHFILCIFSAFLLSRCGFGEGLLERLKRAEGLTRSGRKAAGSMTKLVPKQSTRSASSRCSSHRSSSSSGNGLSQSRIESLRRPRHPSAVQLRLVNLKPTYPEAAHNRT